MNRPAAEFGFRVLQARQEPGAMSDRHGLRKGKDFWFGGHKPATIHKIGL